MAGIKYKGRIFSSGHSLANAMKREVLRIVDTKVKQAASSAGMTASKTTQGYKVRGTTAQLQRFQDRLSK